MRGRPRHNSWAGAAAGVMAMDGEADIEAGEGEAITVPTATVPITARTIGRITAVLAMGTRDTTTDMDTRMAAWASGSGNACDCNGLPGEAPPLPGATGGSFRPSFLRASVVLSSAPGPHVRRGSPDPAGALTAGLSGVIALT